MRETRVTALLGQHIRMARNAKGLSVRELAKRIGVGYPYISQIECAHYTPSEETLKKLCSVLELNFDFMLELAGKLTKSEFRYLRRNPTVATLFRRMREADLRENEIQELLTKLNEIVERKGDTDV